MKQRQKTNWHSLLNRLACVTDRSMRLPCFPGSIALGASYSISKTARAEETKILKFHFFIWDTDWDIGGFQIGPSSIIERFKSRTNAIIVCSASSTHTHLLPLLLYWLRGMCKLRQQVHFMSLVFDILILCSRVQNNYSRCGHGVRQVPVPL